MCLFAIYNKLFILKIQVSLLSFHKSVNLVAIAVTCGEKVKAGVREGKRDGGTERWLMMEKDEEEEEEEKRCERAGGQMGTCMDGW